MGKNQRHIVTGKNRQKGTPDKNNRRMLNGMLWIARTGAQWREMPECYGPWQSVYARFRKWQDIGIWEKIFHILSGDADMENLSIDSTLNTKIHAVVDGLGNPVAFLLSAGTDAGSTHAIELLSQLPIKNSNILGDKAYGAQKIRTYITEAGAVYTIPPKGNSKKSWKCDYWLYKERRLVECFFSKNQVVPTSCHSL